MRKIVLLLAGLVALMGVSSANAEIKIGVVDLQKILTTAPQVNEMRNKLKEQFDPQNKEIQEAKKSLQVEVDKFSKNSSVMKEQERKDAQNKIMDQQKKLREKEMAFQQKLMNEQNKTMQTLSDEIQTAVEKVAKDEKYNLVIAKGATAYNDPSFDITDKVLKTLKK